MSPEQQAEFNKFALQETGKARTQSLIQHVNKICHQKCKTTDTVCLTLCSERYVDMMKFISEKGIIN